MKHFIALQVVLFAVSLSLLGQSKVIFKDDFLNNKQKWTLINDSDFLVKIDSGRLLIQKLEINRISNGCLWYNKKIPNFNTDKNFSIIFYSRVLSFGDITNSFDFQWGSLSDDSIDSLYQITISTKGIRLSYFQHKTGWEYFHWSYNTLPGNGTWLDKGIPFNSIFQLDKFNKYEIQQIDDWIRIKVNNALVYSKQINKISGQCIGIQQCLKGAWEIDKIIIQQ